MTDSVVRTLVSVLKEQGLDEQMSQDILMLLHKRHMMSGLSSRLVVELGVQDREVNPFWEPEKLAEAISVIGLCEDRKAALRLLHTAIIRQQEDMRESFTYKLFCECIKLPKARKRYGKPLPLSTLLAAIDVVSCPNLIIDGGRRGVFDDTSMGPWAETAYKLAEG